MSRRGGRGPNVNRKSTYAKQPSEVFSNRDSSGRNPRVNSTHRCAVGHPYRSWSQYLTRNFDLQLYNEFRRQALDDLFTRHADYGFNALMNFYRSSLLSYQPLPDQVITDMVSLSCEVNFDVHRAIYDLLQWTMRSGYMNDQNQTTANSCFQREYGKPRRGWRNSSR